ncbi:Uncharacterized conserved protein [Ceraceosorus bombacis]|uniref:Uncharacterized conserved protein n=1 Tax=Ceraceosorus bombacis TaxID=401625 RepID=A0A0P1BGK3_9BASI|nr:Uncharacterized conserved protein [Ceraceosorus bombacis]
MSNNEAGPSSPNRHSVDLLAAPQAQDDLIDAGADTQADARPVFKKRGGGKRNVGVRMRGMQDEERGADGNQMMGDDAQRSELEQSAKEADLSIQDLLALRALGKKPAGIALDKLNVGEKKKKKKAEGGAKKAETEEDRWAEQMRRGGLVAKDMKSSGGGGGAESDDEDAQGNRKLVRSNKFSGETGTVDVDAHMLAYIEKEMAARKAAAAATSASEASDGASSQLPTDPRDVVRALNNPEDELYRIAEKYRSLQDQVSKVPDKEESEQGLSAALLSSVPEVDLGMDNRLKNIADTEQAKRAMNEARANRGARREEDELLAASRFFRPKQHAQSDADAMRAAKQDAEVRRGGAAIFPEGHISAPGASAPERRGDGQKRRELASDQLVMERFKKRQRNQLKR